MRGLRWGLFGFVVVTMGCELIGGIDERFAQPFVGAGASGGTGGQACVPDETACNPPMGDCDCDAVCGTNLHQDPENCGRCGRSCGAGRACNAGMCDPEVLVETLPFVYELDHDESTVFFGYGGPAARDPIVAIDKATFTMRPVAVASDPAGVEVRANDVFFTQIFTGGIYRAPRAGGASTLIAPTEAFVNQVEADDEWIYYGNHDADGYLGVVPIGGGAEVQIGNGPVFALAHDASHVYFAGHDRIARVAKASLGGTPVIEPLIEGEGGTPALDDTYVFYDYPPAGEVRRIPKQPTGAISETVIASEPQISVVTLYGDRLYWRSANGIVTAAKDGSDRRVLAINQPGTSGLAVDDDYVYWVGYQDLLHRTPSW